MRFGLFLSQANKSIERVLEDVATAEALGFDHAWLVDHLVDTDGPPQHPIHECWTLMAALARHTSRIRLGTLVTSLTFHHPAVLLKQAVTVDHLSGGRLILGLGSGWHEDEHRRYGVDLPAPRERVDRFEEALDVITRLMAAPDGELVTYHGRHYRLDEAPLAPRPVQQPRIPILVAAHRPRMLRLAARYADQWDTFATIAGTATEGVDDGIEARVAALDAACRAVGRDPATLRRSTWATADALESVEAYRAFAERHHALGFTDLVTVLPRPARLGVLRQVAEEVIPELRAAWGTA
jgi:alkanesulfonate monooxygenase SsuD/methylene tetrahydromethanopterin reductase-like flavin-dependent oxidoreductase (luciferase family)